jgi:hypothetical protein
MKLVIMNHDHNVTKWFLNKCSFIEKEREKDLATVEVEVWRSGMGRGS